MILLLAQKTGFARANIEAIIKLIDEGSTIPFIARLKRKKIHAPLWRLHTGFNPWRMRYAMTKGKVSLSLKD